MIGMRATSRTVKTSELSFDSGRQRAVFYTAGIYILFRCTEAWTFGGEPFSMEGGVGSQAYQVIVLLLTGVVIVAARPWEDLRRLMVLPLTALLAFGWCWLSITWSLAPSISLRRVIQISLVGLVIFLAVRELGYRRSLYLLRWCFAIGLFLSFLALVVDPHQGIQEARSKVESDGTWRGVFIDKNVCGAFCAATISLFLFDARNVKLATRIVVILAATVFLMNSGSKTAMGVQLIGIVVGFVFSQYRYEYRALMIPAGLCAIVAITLGWHTLLAPFEHALYDPHAFTGRGPIWATLVLYIRDNWLLGTGFSAFWAIPNSPVFEYANVPWVRETVRIGHNGYLDLLATIGLPGLLLVLLAFIVMPFVQVMMHARSAPARISLVISIVVFIIGQNFTESSLLHEKSFVTVILLIMTALSYSRVRAALPTSAATRVRAMNGQPLAAAPVTPARP